MSATLDYSDLQVAPYVGAWIETGQKTEEYRAIKVAPYVGAWIETAIASERHSKQ